MNRSASNATVVREVYPMMLKFEERRTLFATGCITDGEMGHGVDVVGVRNGRIQFDLIT